MRYSSIWIPKKRWSDNISSVDVTTNLLNYSGIFRQSSAGIFTLMPMGMRILEKIQNIIRQEMDHIGGQYVSMPNLLSSKYWKITKRWDSSVSGSEMFKLLDRKETEFCLGPTHEEEVTRLVASEVSYSKLLPLKIYQIGKKFRDEYRPRAGLLRGREFVMKDMYSFDITPYDAMKTYHEVTNAYHKVFNRIGVPFVVADADPGNIGGSLSHEYHYLAAVGEDTVLTCWNCKYTTNEETAFSKFSQHEIEEFKINMNSLEDALSSWKQFSSYQVYYTTNKYISSPTESNELSSETATATTNNNPPSSLNLFFIAPERNWNQIYLNKFQNSTGINTTDMMTDLKPEILYENNYKRMNFVFDKSVPTVFYMKFKSLIDSIPNAETYKDKQLSLTEEGDACPKCNNYEGNTQKHFLSSTKAIEIAHTFYLGAKYSEPLKAKVLASNNKNGKTFTLVMGCYGIGVSRLIAAIAEATRDEKGLNWPLNVAPFPFIIVPNNKTPKEDVEEVYTKLQKVFGRNQVLLDDRTESLGFKMKDAEYMGFPYIVLIGKRYMSKQPNNKQDGDMVEKNDLRLLELFERKSSKKEFLTIEDISKRFSYFKEQEF